MGNEKPTINMPEHLARELEGDNKNTEKIIEDKYEKIKVFQEKYQPIISEMMKEFAEGTGFNYCDFDTPHGRVVLDRLSNTVEAKKSREEKK